MENNSGVEEVFSVNDFSSERKKGSFKVDLMAEGHGAEVPGGFFEEEKKEEEFLTSKEEIIEKPKEEKPVRVLPVQVFVLKTQIGRELDVVNSIYARLKRIKAQIYSVLSPNEIRGYIFIEARDKNEVKRAVSGVSHTQSMLRDTVPHTEIERFLVPTSAVERISEGNIVEIIAGPFKGAKARVKSVDERKEEITVELIEAMIPIPVTLKGEQARVIEKEGI